jgi:hypothetical protein
MGKLTDPQSMDRYIYARDDPEKYVDPTGHTINGRSFTDFGGAPGSGDYDGSLGPYAIIALPAGKTGAIILTFDPLISTAKVISGFISYGYGSLQIGGTVFGRGPLKAFPSGGSIEVPSPGIDSVPGGGQVTFGPDPEFNLGSKTRGFVSGGLAIIGGVYAVFWGSYELGVDYREGWRP